MSEIELIIREARREDKIRDENNPKECFVIDHDYVSVFCDPWMADQYYEKAKQQICLECRHWAGDDGGCLKPFGFKHLVSIVKGFLWRLKWKFPPLDWLYIYHFRLTRRSER